MTGVEEPATVKESKIEEGIRCNMAGSSSFVPRSLPVFDGKLFDNWRVKMLAVFDFQDVIEMVTVGFVESGRNAIEEQRLIFKQQQKLDSKAQFLIYQFAVIEELKDLDTMEVEELQHSLEAHEMRAPTTKEKEKVPEKGINPAQIRNTKIKNLVKLVNPLKKGGQIKHRSKAAAPKKSNEAQPRIPIEEEEKELIATPVFNKASTIRRPLQLRDQELFQDSIVNLEGELIHFTLIAETKPIEFEKAKAEIDHGEVYAPIAKIETIRLVVAITINASQSMHQLDVKSVFLNGLLQEEMSDLGLLFYFLGIEFEMSRCGMVMHQTKYAKDLLKKLNMQQSNPIGTPIEVGLSLKKETDEEQVDPTHYRRIVGCLSVGLANRFMQEPKQSHLLTAKIILRYVQGTVDFGILFPKKEVVIEPKLVGYSDSHWCEDKQDRKSTIWYIFFYGGTPISWSFTKEPVVALSSCEAEYIAASETACQVEKNSKKVKLLVDNKSTIYLARRPTSHGRSKLIETRINTADVTGSVISL
ncbi:Copia protein, partial [Mucuna pruriens]